MLNTLKRLISGLLSNGGKHPEAKSAGAEYRHVPSLPRYDEHMCATWDLSATATDNWSDLLHDYTAEQIKALGRGAVNVGDVPWFCQWVDELEYGGMVPYGSALDLIRVAIGGISDDLHFGGLSVASADHQLRRILDNPCAVCAGSFYQLVKSSGDRLSYEFCTGCNVARQEAVQ